MRRPSSVTHSAPRRRVRLAACVAALGSITLLGACGGGDDGGGGSAAKSCAAPSGASAASSLTFDATEYAFAPDSADAKAGVIEITLTDGGKLPHTLVFEDCTAASKASVTGGGEDDTMLVKLDAGTYTFYCDVPGHRGLGMEGTLKVS